MPPLFTLTISKSLIFVTEVRAVVPSKANIELPSVKKLSQFVKSRVAPEYVIVALLMSRFEVPPAVLNSRTPSILAVLVMLRVPLAEAEPIVSVPAVTLSVLAVTVPPDTVPPLARLSVLYVFFGRLDAAELVKLTVPLIDVILESIIRLEPLPVVVMVPLLLSPLLI